VPSVYLTPDEQREVDNRVTARIVRVNRDHNSDDWYVVAAYGREEAVRRWFNEETAAVVRERSPFFGVDRSVRPSSIAGQVAQPPVSDSLYKFRDAVTKHGAEEHGFPPPYRADIMRVVHAPKPPGDLHWLGVIGKVFALLAENDLVVRGWQLEFK
jgi:hypothetical protein